MFVEDILLGTLVGKCDKISSTFVNNCGFSFIIIFKVSDFQPVKQV